ncbi:MAG TPA: SLC13 family permease [Sphingorhabdus sp.]|uniref:SLC13 family permease n=1 Tax=Sphingorhabdus sp. TaxID=1902408 RepID=UPI002CC1309E|nr:SLC13 family permease [Sphingorhabdus sp.]HMT41507.1 SLC13 family permease [Sphingorhabdus sp.]HMU20947.1 SLC13 family permease [Sphingorhabdus sp.]
MTGLPSPHAAAAMLLAFAMFYGFVRGKVAVEIVSLLTIGAIALGLYFFPLPSGTARDGLVLAFEGFGHHALVTICALMIMGRGLVVTGALDPAARALNRIWLFNRQGGLLVTLLAAFGFSMIINDTPVLVLLLPILVQLATKGGMPASKTLIPVNSAILIGGMATTIGTSTNLLVVSIATDLGMPPISVFHYTPIVLAASLVALPYIWLVMPRLLPDNSVVDGRDPRSFHATMRFSAGSASIGKTIGQLRAMLPVSVVLAGDSAGLVDTDTRLALCGPQEALEEAAQLTAGALAPVWLLTRLQRESARLSDDLMMVEMAITPDSRLIGNTLQTAGIEDVAIIGVHHARRLLGETRIDSADAPMGEGDLLLALGTQNALQGFAHDAGLLIVEGGRDMPRSSKAALALTIMIGAVALASFGLMPIAISALGGAVLMFLTGCVKFERVGRALSAKVIVLVASSIALGKFVLVSGAAAWLGDLLAAGLQYLPPAGILAAIMLFVTALTNFASNATAAAVGTPIAYSLAQSLGLPPEPLVLAVLFGCNLCYATPVAYQTNMMIMSEGNYNFGDYVRTGVPLVVLMVVTLSILLALRYGM